MHEAGLGGTIILLDGTYHNEGYLDGNHWKNAGRVSEESTDTIRIVGCFGTAETPITIKGDTPSGHVLRGDGKNIVFVRKSQHIVLEDLNVEGDVESIPLEDATYHRFDYKFEGEDELRQRICPELEPQHIELMKPLSNIKKRAVDRPTYYTTNGILVQNSRHVHVKNSEVGYCPGTGLRLQTCDYVNATGNLIHNNSRRSSVGNHGFVIHSITNEPSGFQSISDDGYRIRITGNTVRENYNEVYSWSKLKTIVTPHIDEGKGITVQKSYPETGRILIANNVVYNNGFSGVHTNFASSVDIYHNTAIDNTRSGGGNSGITVSDSTGCNVMNNIAYNVGKGKVYGTDSKDLVSDEISFLSNLAIGDMAIQLDDYLDNFIFSTLEDLLLQDAPEYRIEEGSSAEGQGDSSVLSVVPTDIYGEDRNDPPDLGASNVVSSRRLARNIVSNLPSVHTLVNYQSHGTKPMKEKSTRSLEDTCTDSIEFGCFCEFIAALARNKRMKLCSQTMKDEDDIETPVTRVCPITCEASCPEPTSSPTPAPERCDDNPDKFVSNNGNKIKCVWVAKNPEERCSKENAPENCPVSCDNLSDDCVLPTPAPTLCEDNPEKFDSKGKKRTCEWAATNPDAKCPKENVSRNCPVTCNSLWEGCDMPTLEPTSLRCTDNPDKFDSKGKKIKCVWVAKNPEVRCEKENAPENCPEACNSVPDSCEPVECINNTDEFESNKGKMRTCDWVAKNAEIRCDNDNVMENCAALCNPACE